MKKLNKKGAFDAINTGMIKFISFVLIAILVVLLVSTVKQTKIVCPSPAFILNDACLTCPAGDYSYNSSADVCCNSSGIGIIHNCVAGNTTNVVDYTGFAYNATLELEEAAALPPQFAQIMVIIVIIVGIIGMLAFIGYGAYKKLQG